MKILVDCTGISAEKAGVGVYALNLVRGLCNSPERNFELYLLAQDDDKDFQIQAEGVHVLTVSSRLFRFIPFRLVMEQLYIPWLVWKHKIDVVHSLHYSFPFLPTRARKIVTIHDMTSFLMPEVHLRSRVIYFRGFITAASRRADAQIFVSQSTQKDWEKRFSNSSVVNYTIPLGKGSQFRADMAAASIAPILSKYGVTEPYILYIGTIEPRKNLARLVSAFGRIADEFPAHRLVIAGKKWWGHDEMFSAIEELKLDSRIVFTGFVEEADKAQLLAGAEIFVYVSLYEGFGIPVLEAMACGTPTVTCATSSLLEVAGDGALLADPVDVADIADKMKQLLESADLRRVMRNRAIEQAAKFSWDRMVAETIGVYSAVGSAGRSRDPERSGQPLLS